MYRMSYYPWITQHRQPAEIREQIEVFADELGRALQQDGAADPRVEVLQPLDVPDQIRQIVAGEAEIALMNPLGFVFARQQSEKVEAIAVAKRIIDGRIGVDYFAQLYARRDGGIRSLRDAAARSVGYGAPFSTSNFLMPAAMLQKAGVHPFCGFLRTEFVGGHDLVAKAVYHGKVALGAGHDGVIVDLANQPNYADATQVLVQVERSAPIHSDPVATRIDNEGERAAVQRALIAAGATERGARALRIFWGEVQGLAETTSDDYAPLLDALNLLKLGREELLPPRRTP